VDILREIASTVGLRHLARKVFADRGHPLLKELQWHIEARQWEETFDRVAPAVLERASSVDVLHAETLFAGAVCLRVLERRRIPFVFDMHGILREEAKLTGSAEWAAWCSRWERRLVEAAQHVLVVSPLMGRYVHREYGVAPERIVVVPNGSYPTERCAQYTRPMTIVYAGNLAAFEHPLEYVKTAERAAGSYRFWLLGDGPMRNEVLDYINARSVDVCYWGRKRREAALERCAQAQVAFSGQAGAVDLARDHPRQLGCPIKLFDYATLGLPLVLPRGEWSPVFERADCGVVVDAPEAGRFETAIAQLDDEATWARLSRNGRELVRSTFDWDSVLAPLAPLYGAESRRTHVDWTALLATPGAD